MALLRKPRLTPQARRKILKLEQLIKYDFKDMHLACLAIQVVRKRWRGGNRGLAIQGDNLVYVVLCQGWLPSGGMDGYGGCRCCSNLSAMHLLMGDIAAWHRLRTRYASNRHFARSVKGRLEQCLLCNRIRGMRELNVEMLGTAVEAIIGAVYEDCNHNVEQVESVAIALGILPQDHISTDRIVRWDEDMSERSLSVLDDADDWEDAETDKTDVQEDNKGTDLLSLGTDSEDKVVGREVMQMTNVQALATLSFGGTGTFQINREAATATTSGKNKRRTMKTSWAKWTIHSRL